jgi:hypothetical protein
VKQPGFRRPREGEVPTEGDLGELLEDPPEGVPSSLAAYRAGSRVRRWVFGSLLVGIVGAGFAGKWYVDHLEATRRERPVYRLSDSLENRPQSFEWSSGQARLGLARQAPGVQEIVLPDRIVRLADGYDHAQIRVIVEDGETVSLDVLVGKIVEEPR